MKKVTRFLTYFFTIHLIVILLSHCTFSHFSKKSYKLAKKEKPYDVVIVPGVPYAPNETNDVMRMRVFWAKHLYDSGYTRNIIFSGSSVYSPYVEGKVMKALADSLGIPPEHTFSETRAEHSTENIWYGWKMAKKMGFKKIALATDPFQAGLLRGFVKRHTPGVRPVPVVFGMLDIENKKLPVIDTTSLYIQNFEPITKRESFWQRFRGTMGKRVREEKKAEEEARKNGRTDAVGD